MTFPLTTTNICMAKESVFTDTSAWIALCDKKDQFHQKAKAHLDILEREQAILITTNLIIHETAVLLSRRASRKAAVRFVETSYADRNISVIQSDYACEKKAYGYFKKYQDHDFSIADCVSFAVMNDMKIKRAFSFDAHFSIMGFIIEPR